jgi:TldD protein
MDTISSARGDGLGARIIKGGNTIYSRSTGTTAADAAKALSSAAEAAGLPGVSSADDATPLIELESRLPALDAGFFHDLDKKLRGECRYVRQITLRYSTSLKSVSIFRGDGEVVKDARAYTRFAAQVVLERGGKLETGYETRALMSEAGDFWSGAAPEAVAREALDRAILMLDAAPCPAGAMMVLMDGSAGGTMIHEACGHSLEADIIQKDFSAFRDKIGELVANPLVTMIDDATLPSMYGSYAFDDEGTPAERTVLIEDGVLKSYMTDRLSAMIGGLRLTGNGRRESFGNLPLPRMSNTFVMPGTSKRDEMIAMTPRGLLVKKMGGGEVNPTSGDFVFYVSEGYIIENGKVGAAVRGATLTGSGPEALKNIMAVGDSLEMLPGVCGKSGQGVPVTDGQPSILIGNIIVGGTDTGDAI